MESHPCCEAKTKTGFAARMGHPVHVKDRNEGTWATARAVARGGNYIVCNVISFASSCRTAFASKLNLSSHFIFNSNDFQ